ncbi:hypothetical protein EGH24_01665 [Halonotius terrestris]|uniref:Uncharacterized protein n=1 Tax=Halonotius terrestris TaxID=2487750 RepID=A0A8J8PBU3_9EURY|nr:hypothetical protein [Halonotius terrestris]TQQ83524.1 hypothetical protein EGH24_01665 [Halonotius terrestris]
MKRSLNRAVETDEEADRADTTGESAPPDSSAVEWRDLSAKSSAPDASSPATETPSPTADTTVVTDPTVTNRIRSQSGPSLTIETDMLTATLVGVPKVSIADLVYAHQRDTVADAGAVRYCAMFDVENVSDAPIHWLSRRTTFIGSDGYTYEQAHVSLDSSELAPGCHTNQVVIEPRCRARVITPVEQLPQGVDIAKVVHTVPSNSDAGNQRLIYTL